MKAAPGKRVVVAGGSLAGHSAVSELVNLVPECEILWLTGETHRTYSKPALSKEFMQARHEVAEILLPDIDPQGSGLRIIRNRPCRSIDCGKRRVELADGEAIGFDYLIICTGARARMPAMLEGRNGVHALRTLDNAIAIRSRLTGGSRILVIGGGLIGCEFAASMRALGLHVALVEQLPTLLDRPFGGALGAYFDELHRGKGVALHMGARVDRLIMDEDRAVGAILSDGTEIEADIIVVGAGCQPSTQWLEGSGLQLDDGVICDAWLAASEPGIYAAGDVANWYNTIFGMRMRVEHWTNASAQGRAAARNVAAAISGRPELARIFADVPYFWSDQYGQKIQLVGWHAGHDRVQIEQPKDTSGPMVKFYRGDRLVAAAAVNAPRAIMRLRKRIEEESHSPVHADADRHEPDRAALERGNTNA